MASDEEGSVDLAALLAKRYAKEPETAVTKLDRRAEREDVEVKPASRRKREKKSDKSKGGRPRGIAKRGFYVTLPVDLIEAIEAEIAAARQTKTVVVEDVLRAGLEQRRKGAKNKGAKP